MADLEARVRQLAEPLARDADVALVDVDVRGAGPSQLVRVIVDRKGGVSIDDCQQLSRRLSEVLDAEDPIEHRYSLEVTSPGTDHPLVGRAAFDRVEDRVVLVQHDAGDGRVLQTRGTVQAAGEHAVTIDVDGDRVDIAYADIVKATQALPW